MIRCIKIDKIFGYNLLCAIDVLLKCFSINKNKS